MRSLTSSVDETMRDCVERSRSKTRTNFDDVMWRSIFEYGSLTSLNSAEIGLVDTTPPVDPLIPLLDVNAGEEERRRKRRRMRGGTRMGAGKTDADDDDVSNDARRKFEGKFGMHDSYRKFDATESVILVRYLDMLNRKDQVERTRGRIDGVLRRLSGMSIATSMILSALGLVPNDDALSSSSSSLSLASAEPSDRIAVLTVDGTIDRSCASRIIRSLREIKKDKRVKAVVLRVDSPGGSVVSSEAILEEVKLLDKVRIFFSLPTVPLGDGFVPQESHGCIFTAFSFPTRRTARRMFDVERRCQRRILHLDELGKDIRESDDVHR